MAWYLHRKLRVAVSHGAQNDTPVLFNLTSAHTCTIGTLQRSALS
jgi:hypothetical protein